MALSRTRKYHKITWEMILYDGASSENSGNWHYNNQQGTQKIMLKGLMYLPLLLKLFGNMG